MGAELLLEKGVRMVEMSGLDMDWFKTSGIVRYSSGGIMSHLKRRPRHTNKWWMVIDIDQGILDYYYFLYRKGTYNTIPLQRPFYSAHISVIKAEEPDDSLKIFWGKHEGAKVDVFYSHQISESRGGIYRALTAYCPAAYIIREELGLKNLFFDYHITIGNLKNRGH